MGVTRHIEFTIDFDYTTWAEDMEDFESDDAMGIYESLMEYLNDCSSAQELVDEKMKLHKIWYEED